MKSEANPLDNLTAKVIACLFILICLAIGAAGLILPIIPGLLFLALAALVAAKHSPSLDRVLRRNRTMSGYLDTADGFVGLPFWRKVQFGGLLCLKMLIDGIAYTVSVVTRLVTLAVVKYRYR
jgi:uncharacterized membrane protein YbaN (DUF454 family)